jgi:hypothetical protein
MLKQWHSYKIDVRICIGPLVLKAEGFNNAFYEIKKPPLKGGIDNGLLLFHFIVCIF